jgi:predicted adenylyl cyclase CyaB
VPTNIEIKAHMQELAAVEAIAARLSGRGPEIMHQLDIFFQRGPARLKLRILGPDRGELIQYERPNRPEARASHYAIARTTDPYVLRDILARTLGIVGTVQKERRVFLIEQTRVHLDRVEGLGNFLELEVVLRSGQSEAKGQEIIKGLLRQFGIEPGQIVAEAYIDLLSSQSAPPL